MEDWILRSKIRYNNADKDYRPTAYTLELAMEQFNLYNDYQEKGTYLRIFDKTKKDILRSIILKLHSILCLFKEIGDPGIWETLCNSLIQDAEDAVKGG